MIRILICILVSCLVTLEARSQSQSTESTVYTVDLRNIDLDAALAEFSAITGSGVTYDPRLTKGLSVYCIINEAEINDVLLCLLDSTQLTFARLASGTFVVMPKGNVPPQNGYLSGLVTDRATGTPLPDAHVLLASNTLDIGAITNHQGQFTLPALLPGKYILQTTYLGYSVDVDTLDVLPGTNTFQRIALVSQPVHVTPIVIDGLHLRKPSKALERTLLLRSSTAEQIDEANYLSQFQAIPGIRMNDITADAHLQGSNSGEHQLRIDGVPVFLPQQAVGIIGPFSPFAIQSLTIHKSGFGVEEGSHLAGVIEARQFLESDSRLDAQLDLNAINNRLSWQKEWRENKSFSIMAATRFSLWDLISQPQLQDMLNNWARPDPFLIFSPSQQFSSIDLSLLQNTLDISPIPTTELSFTDIHVATSFKSNAFSGFKTSLYYGANQYGGSLIPPAIFNYQSLDPDPPTPVSGGDVTENSLQPILSVIDDYKWQNLAGHIQFHSLIGKNALFNLKLKGSTYALDQRYLQVDSLEQIIAAIPESDFSTVSIENLRFPTSEIKDRNTTAEYALEAQLDIATGRHSFLIGVASTYSTSTLDALLTSLPSLQAETDDLALPGDAAVAVTDKERVGYNSNTFRQSFFVQDRISLSSNTTLELGSRLTYLPNRKTVYAEPRASVRFDFATGANGSLAIQTAAGLYRQYLLQLDVSTLNAGALFPSKRLWVPVNEDIRPPVAYHVSQSFLYNFSSRFTVQAEGYLKYQQRLWFLNYVTRDQPLSRSGTRFLSTINDLNDILSEGKGITHGVSVTTSWRPSPFSLSVVYDYTSVRRKSEDLFLDTWFSAPWEEPHRLATRVEWNYQNALWFSARFTGIWGRSWGFRQAYYDFFGHSDLFVVNGDYDFSNPDEHVLPAYYQVDIGAVYNIRLEASNLQLRVDLLNAFDISNVADWRLAWKDGRLEKENRYYYPAIPTVALRFSW